MPHSAWLRRPLGGALVALLALVGVEGCLRRWGGVAADRVASPLAYQSIDQVERTVRGPQGRGADLLRWGRWGRATPKRAAGLRVVVFGGSTTEGERVGPFFAFSGLLERALEAEVGAPVEVINVGQAGAANRHVALQIGQVLAEGPVDLLIVYSGDNEFLEILGLKTAVPGWSAQVELTRRRLWRLHLYRALARAVVPALNRSPAPSGVGAQAHQLTGRVEPEERELVELLHREALHEMIDRAQAAGVPILLATVADNLRYPGRFDGPPTSPGGLGPTDLDRLDALALLTDDRLRELLPDEAALSGAEWFALGERLLTQGRGMLGVEALLHAERLDTRPHRSNHRMRADLLAIAEARGAASCDVAGAFLEHGNIGDDAFLDACHPNHLGHERIAQALLGCIEAQGLLPTGGAADAPLPAPRDPSAIDGLRDLRRDEPPGHGEDGSWPQAMGAAQQALLQQRPTEAARWVEAAAARGAPAATVARSRLLVQIYGDERVEQAAALLPAIDAAGDPGLAARWGRAAPQP